MEISINADHEVGCIVRLGSCAVPFRCEAAAGQFVERLRQRLGAMHVLPVWPRTQVAERVEEPAC